MKKDQETKEAGAENPVLSFEEYLEDLKLELQREEVLTEENVFDYAEVAA